MTNANTNTTNNNNIMEDENMTKTIINELLKDNKKILKCLHFGWGFDFMQDYKAYKHSGKFTANTIKKIIGITDIDNYNIVILLKDFKYCNNNIYYATLYNNGFGLSCPRRFYVDNSKMWNFYTKTSFEDARKDSNTTAYIIVQDKKHTTPEKKNTIDFNNRYKVVWCCGWSDGKSSKGWSRFDIIEPCNGKRINYKCRKPSASTNKYYFIDKSGYILSLKK